MNIEVENLDLSYEQCRELNNLSSNEGKKMVDDLIDDIKELKNHWIGNDATEHINHLIEVENAMANLVDASKKISSAAGDAVSSIQSIRKANGGSGNVGEHLSSTPLDRIVISKNELTDKYDVKPEAKNDYAKLEQICNDFESLKSKYETQKDALLSNWKSGADRELAVKCFDDFLSNADTYKKYLNDAKENLGIAVSNMSQL